MSATHSNGRFRLAARSRLAAKFPLGALAALLLAAGVSGSSGALAEKPAATSAQRESHRVELNGADVEELCTLPGIGPKKAEAIIAFRERKPFTRVTQLLRVRGIGVKTLQRLRPLIYVAPPGPPKPAALSRGDSPTPVPIPGG